MTTPNGTPAALLVDGDQQVAAVRAATDMLEHRVVPQCALTLLRRALRRAMPPTKFDAGRDRRDVDEKKAVAPHVVVGVVDDNESDDVSAQERDEIDDDSINDGAGELTLDSDFQLPTLARVVNYLHREGKQKTVNLCTCFDAFTLHSCLYLLI